VVVAVGVKGEGVEEGKARVRAVQLCYRHGAVELGVAAGAGRRWLPG
jgi:hypothetical protein